MPESFNKYFYYRDNRLFCENIPVKEIIESIKTPFYIYSKKAIEDRINEYKNAFKDYPILICYATKANPNLSILYLINKNGLGADIVSGGELFKARLAGISPNKIVYAGVGKTDDEIKYAIKEEILSFNVESEQEIEVLNQIGKSLNKKANISIRVNPDVNPKTHPYISTGLNDSKFGIDIKDALNVYKMAVRKKYINVVGIHCHIGSQIVDISPYKEAIEKVVELVFKLKKEGIELNHIDIGGGLGIRYKPEDQTPDIKDLANIIIPIVKETGLKLILEPGRSLVGEAGALITQVIFTKMKQNKNFVIVDSGMNDLVRPAIYEAYHHILSVERKDSKIKADIVGPICETGDFFAKERLVDNVGRGDYLAIMSVGAYGLSMASNYNVRPKAAEVLVDGEKFYLIREHEDYNYLVEKEINPLKRIKEIYP